MKDTILLLLLSIFLTDCTKQERDGISPPEVPQETNNHFLRGADLSYVNEMIDCDAVYYDSAGVPGEPFQLFADYGAELVRLRLWHSPEWTNYSTLTDVQRSIRKAKKAGLPVLLDLHYSDDWADPQKQLIPRAWYLIANDVPVLADSVYNYTYRVLRILNEQGLLPEMVQVGNETNIEMLQTTEGANGAINWSRNAPLLKSGIRAVRQAAADFNVPIDIVLHIAQPENALWWFEQANMAGVNDFDWIGISYYPKWSDYGLEELPQAIRTLINTYQKRLMVVETAYPFTMNNTDAAGNILGSDALIEGYPASPQGQLQYLQDLEAVIREGGGEGLLYWEPAWISNSCRTRWGQGSHWDNATLFGQDSRPLVGMKYFN